MQVPVHQGAAPLPINNSPTPTTTAHLHCPPPLSTSTTSPPLLISIGQPPLTHAVAVMVHICAAFFGCLRNLISHWLMLVVSRVSPLLMSMVSRLLSVGADGVRLFQIWSLSRMSILQVLWGCQTPLLSIRFVGALTAQADLEGSGSCGSHWVFGI